MEDLVSFPLFWAIGMAWYKKVHDEENPDQENSGEDFRNLMEDNSGLPMPKGETAASPVEQSKSSCIIMCQWPCKP